MENKNAGMRKVLYLLLAFCVAVMIWFYVDETSGRTVEVEIAEIPITYMGQDTVLADRGLMLMDEGTDTTMDVTERLPVWTTPAFGFWWIYGILPPQVNSGYPLRSRLFRSFTTRCR